MRLPHILTAVLFLTAQAATVHAGKVGHCPAGWSLSDQAGRELKSLDLELGDWVWSIRDRFDENGSPPIVPPPSGQAWTGALTADQIERLFGRSGFEGLNSNGLIALHHHRHLSLIPVPNRHPAGSPPALGLQNQGKWRWTAIELPGRRLGWFRLIQCRPGERFPADDGKLNLVNEPLDSALPSTGLPEPSSLLIFAFATVGISLKRGRRR